MDDPPATPENDSSAWKEAALRRQLGVLEQLAEAGLRLALTIETEAAGAAAAGRPVRDDAAMGFSRVARAVRLSVMLQARLIEGPQVAGASRAGLDQADAFHGPIEVCWGEPEPPARVEPPRSRQVKAIVRGVAEDAALDRETVERLVVEAGERLERDDIHFLVRGRPLGELVARICLDLGLDPDWSRLAQEAWAEPEIANPAPRSPFFGLVLDRGLQTAERAPAFHGSS